VPPFCLDLVDEVRVQVEQRPVGLDLHRLTGGGRGVAAAVGGREQGRGDRRRGDQAAVAVRGLRVLLLEQLLHLVGQGVVDVGRRRVRERALHAGGGHDAGGRDGAGRGLGAGGRGGGGLLALQQRQPEHAGAGDAEDGRLVLREQRLQLLVHSEPPGGHALLEDLLHRRGHAALLVDGGAVLDDRAAAAEADRPHDLRGLRPAAPGRAAGVDAHGGR
jgi:hypothetical protein